MNKAFVVMVAASLLAMPAPIFAQTDEQNNSERFTYPTDPNSKSESFTYPRYTQLSEDEIARIEVPNGTMELKIIDITR